MDILPQWDTIEQLIEQHAWVGWTLGTLSVVTLLVSIIFIPRFVVALPEDYFSDQKRETNAPTRRGWCWRVIKNCIGVFLFLEGVAMLVLPGQGLLTMLIGLALMDLPGKRMLERRLFRAPGVSQLISWLRERAGVAPLRLD
ncbi:MAG: hypothetical protein ACI8PT_001113 [Gammaproteobacteria bacterium]|jgi:hypothetical protein